MEKKFDNFEENSYEYNLKKYYKMINNRSYFFTPLYYMIYCPGCKFTNTISMKIKYFTCKGCLKDYNLNENHIQFKVVSIKNKFDDFSCIFEKFILDTITNFLDEEYDLYHDDIKKIEIKDYLKCFEKNQGLFEKIKYLSYFKEIKEKILNSNQLNLITTSKKDEDGLYQNDQSDYENLEERVEKIVIKYLFEYWILLKKFLQINVFKSGFYEIDQLMRLESDHEIIEDDNLDKMPSHDEKYYEEFFFSRDREYDRNNFLDNLSTNRDLTLHELEEYREDLNYCLNCQTEISQDKTTDEVKIPQIEENPTNISSTLTLNKINETILLDNNSVSQSLKEKIIEHLKEKDSAYLSFINAEEKKFIESQEKVKSFFEENRTDLSYNDYIVFHNDDERHFKRGLPIYLFKFEIIQSITNNKLTIIVSETGSGKTTQIVQYCLSLFNLKRRFNSQDNPILCSQPRKISSISVAERLCQETGFKLGEDIKAIYLDNNFNLMDEIKSAKIVFINESILLNQLIADPYLVGINILILDEAHERSLNLDIILYFLRKFTLTREDFRLVITSATMNTTQLVEYFNRFNPSVIECNKNSKSKNYTVYYSDVDITPFNYFQNVHNFLKDFIEKYFNSQRIYENEDGEISYKNISAQTILVFLPDLKSIASIRDSLESYFDDLVSKKLLFFFELFGSLTYEEQEKIINFEHGRASKVILCTNVAETSITIKNCNIVIDSGLHKTRKYNSDNRMLEDKIEIISKDSANQRAGRCGRTEPGTCHRLYTESQYMNMKNFRTAEILKVNISYMILKLIFFGIENVNDVEFIEHPHLSDISNCLAELNNLHAIRRKGQDEYAEKYQITEFGKWLYKIQIEPLYGRLLYDVIYKHKAGLQEAMIILSSLCAGDFLIFNKKNTFSIYNKIPEFIEIDKKEEFQLGYSATNLYVKNLTSKIISNTILNSFQVCKSNNYNNEISKVEYKNYISSTYIEKIEHFSIFNEIFSILNPFFSNSLYFLENPVCSLGDCMVNLFFMRQYKMIRCMNHYENLFDKTKAHKHYTISKCLECNYLKNAHANCYSLNKKFLIIASQMEDNIRSTLRITGDYCESLKGLSEECEYNEYLVSYCTAVYVKLYSSYFIKEQNPYYLLENVRRIDLKKIYENIFSNYKSFYIKIIGYSFLRVYSFNMAIRPAIHTHFKQNQHDERDYNHNSVTNLYVMVNSEENCRIFKNSTYYQYYLYLKWRENSNSKNSLENNKTILSNTDFDIFIFCIQSINMNEMNMKNINPIFPEMAKSIPKQILYEVKSLYSKKTFHIFNVDKIGPQIQKFLIEKRKSLKNIGSDNLYQSNALSRLLPTTNNNVNESKVWFFSNKKYYNTDKEFINNLIKSEKENLCLHNVEEYGYLSRDCLVLKIKNGLSIVNVDYNKDQIHYQIILLKQDMTIKELENLLKQKNFIYNKLYTYKKKIYISFRNSQQASIFLKNVKFDDELYKILIIKMIDEDFGQKSEGHDNQEILSLIAPFSAKEEKILKKIESYGKIQDIVIRTWENHKLVYFTMCKISDVKRILERLRAHSDYDGVWSDVKKLNKNLAIALNSKCISDVFWEEFSLFCKENGIVYNKIGKAKIVLEQSTDYNIRKVLTFISEDVINLPEFAVNEIKFNMPQTFFKKHGKDFNEFGKAFKVFIDLFPYFKKLHVYGTPTSRKKVRKIIEEYLDDLNTEYELKLIDVNLLLKRYGDNNLSINKKILTFIQNIRNEFSKERKNFIKINYSIPKKVLEIEARQQVMHKILNDLDIFIQEEIFNIRYNENTIILTNFNYENNFNYVNQTNYSNGVSCEICLDSINQKNVFRLGLCGDVFCRECLRNQIISSINSQPYAELPIKCIKCNELILNSDILSLFKQSEIKFIFYQLTKYFMSLPQGRFYSWCENPNCQFIYKKSHYSENNQMIRECPNCNKTLCILCGTELIGNMHDDQCKTLILKRLSTDDRSWIIKNTTNCPKCNQLYEKSQGCNHMICSKCRPEIHFCYICGKILHSTNPFNHYNDPVNFPYCFNNLYNDVKKISEINIVDVKSATENIKDEDLNISRNNDNEERINLKLILANDDPNTTKRMLQEYEDYFINNDINQDLVKEIKNHMKIIDIEEEELDNYFYEPFSEYSYEKYKDEEEDKNIEHNNLDEGFYEFDEKPDKRTIDKFQDRSQILQKENKEENNMEISYSKYFYDHAENNNTQEMNQENNKDTDEFDDYFIN